jgi:hypothetical protein
MTVEGGYMTISVMYPSAEGFYNLQYNTQASGMGFSIEFFFTYTKFIYKNSHQFIQVTLILPVVVNFLESISGNY